MAHEPVSTALLQQFSPLDGLKRDNLAALARKVQVRELSPGQVLFKEGDTEKRTIYVVSGVLELQDQGTVFLTQAQRATKHSCLLCHDDHILSAYGRGIVLLVVEGRDLQ